MLVCRVIGGTQIAPAPAKEVKPVYSASFGAAIIYASAEEVVTQGAQLNRNRAVGSIGVKEDRSHPYQNSVGALSVVLVNVDHIMLVIWFGVVCKGRDDPVSVPFRKAEKRRDAVARRVGEEEVRGVTPSTPERTSTKGRRRAIKETGTKAWDSCTHYVW